MTLHNSTQMSITLQNVLKSYQMLGSNDYNNEQKQKANIFLYNLVQTNESWEIANKMIRVVENQQFKYLGAQILYQKIQRELSAWLRPSQGVHQTENTYTMLNSLKQFTYTQINKSFNKAIIDKLASCLSLVLITSVIKGKQQGNTNANIKNCQLITEWKDLLQQVIQFMKISEANIGKGVKILERITEELRTCNRFSFRNKTVCKQEFLSQLEKLLTFWKSVFQFAVGYNSNQENAKINPSALLLNIINGLESWVKSGYPLLKYPYLMNMLIKTSIISFQHLQGGSKVICETLKATAQNKFQVLSEIHPSKEKDSYTTDEMQSLKIVVDFVIQHRNNFLPPLIVKTQIRNFSNPMEKYIMLLGTQASSSVNSSKLQSEYSQIYIKIIDELLRNYSFLLFDDVGFQILSLILRATSATDLKLSSQTFEFWIFMCQKMIKAKEFSKDHESPYLNLNTRIQQYINQVYYLILEKNMLDTDILLGQAQIKEQDTVDDSGNVSLSEYRKLSSDLFKAIYDFYVSNGVLPQSNPNGHRAGLFFTSIYNLLNNSLNLEGRGFQLALFVIKSANQSMIDQISTEYILKAIQIILELMNTQEASLPIKVIAQSMNLIRDCTRQIKSADKNKTGKSMFVECLKFVLKYIDNEKLCNYAAYCFQILMETVSTVDNQQLVIGLLQHYRHQKINKKKQEHARAFSLTPIQMVQKDIIIEKVIEGVFNSIVKFQNKGKIPFYLDQFMKIIIDYYNFKENLYVQLQKAPTNQNLQSDQRNKHNKTAIFYDCLLEIKTLLGSYQALSMDVEFKKISHGRFRQLCFHSLSIISKIFESTLNVSVSDSSQPVPKYSIMNELGQSVSTYKSILKICTNSNPKKLKFDDGGISDQQIQNAYAFIMSQIMCVVNGRMIKELCMMLPVISETLFQFTPQSQKTSSVNITQVEQYKRSPIITDWIRKNMPALNQFYIQYFLHFSQNLESYQQSPKQNKMDPDIVKYYFLILESLILYDRAIYAEIVFKDRNSGNMSQQNAQITNFVQFALRYVNQKQLIRRVVAFVSLYISQLICNKNQGFIKYLITSQTAYQQVQKQKQKILSLLIATIPQVPSPSHTIVGKSLYLLTDHCSFQQKQSHFQVLLLRLIAASDRSRISYSQSNLLPQSLSSVQQKNLKLLTKMFTMAVEMRTDRFIKLSFVLLTQVIKAFDGFATDGGPFIRNELLMQIQMNIVTWKREMKNMIQIDTK